MLIKGYGTELPSSEWAEMLKMPAHEVMWYVEQKGLTIEDLFKLRGIKPKEPKKRKPRESAQMVVTKERFGLLLEVSGYIGENETEGILVQRVGTNTSHLVSYQGSIIGVYNYKTGGLRLSGGESFPLRKLDWEEAKIVQGANGQWHLHPDTKALIIKEAIVPFTEKTQTTPQPFTDEMQKELDALYQSAREAEELKRIKRQTYEGFGKKYIAATWARILGVSADTLAYHLNKGRTVEDFAELKGIKIDKD